MPKHATLGVDGKVQAAQLPAGGLDGPGGAVDSVFGRIGGVVAEANDYTFAQLASKPTTLAGYGITDAQALAAVLTNTTASFTTAQETKLAGVATGAEVNVNADWSSGAGDSQILNKPTLGGAAALNVGTTAGTVSAGDHTHTAANVSDFTEASQDVVGAMVAAAGGSYNDGAGTITLPAGGSELVFTGTAGDTAINNTNDVTIVTRDVTSVVAGDQIIVDAWFTILNNSTATRVCVITVDFDALFDIEFSTGALAFSSTLMHPFLVRAVCDVRATNLAYMMAQVTGQLAAGIASGGDTTMAATHLTGMGWGTSASNATGTTTVALKVRSANATATQTLRLHSFTIRKVHQT